VIVLYGCLLLTRILHIKIYVEKSPHDLKNEHSVKQSSLPQP
jgi:hypothetical protein